eukprot:TRINITY_DN13030_c0_g1_i1.p1 TRINITY_DN13030_c0_g1~~TRINITY_DN13030_c0_g1_i1.p1  ORF type:complete len:490 (+),score=121.54 TRINITY_DN13030_c0_g1_i1:45-1514(+)
MSDDENDLEDLLEDLGDDIISEDEEEVLEAEDMMKYTDVQEVAKVLRSDKMLNHITEIEEANDSKDDAGVMTVDSKEYALMLESNRIVTEITRDINKVHKFVKDHFAVKFPELESYSLDPIQYCKTVKCIGNVMDTTTITASLSDILDKKDILVVQTMASSSKGRKLTEHELETVLNACDEILGLEEAKQLILEFVQSRMKKLAPNLSAFVGTSIAALLTGAAGGILALSKLQSNVIKTLGKTKKTLGGMAATTQLYHAGYLLNTDIVSAQTHEYKRKAVGLVANKATLSIRADADRSISDGSYGKQLREQVFETIKKWKERPPAKIDKALPAPRDNAKRKRAGAKYQRMRAKWKQTTVSKHMNRMSFGEIEEDNLIEGRNYNSLKKSKINFTAESKVRAKQAKPTQPKVGEFQSGLASSLVFTPVQGMDLGAADIAPKQEFSSSKYFGDTSGFKSSTASGGASYVGSTVTDSTDIMAPPGKKMKLGGS